MRPTLGSMCKCKPMINMAETMLKNEAHLLARGLGEMRKSGDLPSNQASKIIIHL